MSQRKGKPVRENLIDDSLPDIYPGWYLLIVNRNAITRIRRLILNVMIWP